MFIINAYFFYLISRKTRMITITVAMNTTRRMTTPRAMAATLSQSPLVLGTVSCAVNEQALNTMIDITIIKQLTRDGHCYQLTRLL